MAAAETSGGAAVRLLPMRIHAAEDRMKVSIHFAALHYLNLWLSKERAIYKCFHDERMPLAALQNAAKHFRVARSLPRKFDTDERFGPVLKILQSLDADPHVDPIGTVDQVCNKISRAYGNVRALSFTTKVLWLKFRSPIIIYDRQARTALRKLTNTEVKLTDFDDYWLNWQLEFKRHRSKVEEACGSLVKVRKYFIDRSVPASELESWARARWFQERVFDSYLWHFGSE